MQPMPRESEKNIGRRPSSKHEEIIRKRSEVGREDERVSAAAPGWNAT